MNKPRSHYRHMTASKADEIRRLYFSRAYKQQQLADLYGIHKSSVSRIISGYHWVRE